MTDLIVKDVSKEIVEALKKRAAIAGISTEAEHKKILRVALIKSKKKPFSEAIKSIPNVGEDSDFCRVEND